MADNTNRPTGGLAPNNERGKLNPLQQHFGISLEELRMERRAEALMRPKGKRQRK